MNIYELKLHESMKIFDSNGWNNDITRVAGGWLYTIETSEKMTTTFVPFNNEFQK